MYLLSAEAPVYTSNNSTTLFSAAMFVSWRKKQHTPIYLKALRVPSRIKHPGKG